jgi:hypothetical protein
VETAALSVMEVEETGTKGFPALSNASNWWAKGSLPFRGMVYALFILQEPIF